MPRARSRQPVTARTSGKGSSWRAARSTPARRSRGWTCSWSSPVRLRDALAQPGLAAIAEIKRRSPSAGDLRPDADPARLAAEFAAAGASAISVLVDERFGGSLDDLRAARAATRVPLLGKGFFREESQLRELREAGADAALLLLRDLDDAAAAG